MKKKIKQKEQKEIIFDLKKKKWIKIIQIVSSSKLLLK